MILKRIAQGIKDQDWFVVSIEVLIVVVGIFIGLQVDDWNENRKQARAERVYIQQIHDDMLRIEDELSAKIRFEQRNIENSEIFHLTVIAPDFQPDAAALHETLFFISRRMSVTFESPVFIDLQSSGKLSLLMDEDIRTKLIAYFSFLDKSKVILEKNNTVFIDNTFNPFLRALGIGYYSVPPDSDRLFENEIAVNEGTNNTFKSGLLRQTPKILASPKGHPVWEELSMQISWKAMASFADKNRAEELLKLSRDLRLELKQYLREE